MYPTNRATASRPFVIGVYRGVRDGAELASLPPNCPAGVDGEEACSLYVHHLRERSTGPEHPLAVCRCVVHEVTFTVYPPGYVPYSRQPVAPVAEKCMPAERPGKVSEWKGTVFDAALDAAAGRAWSQQSLPGYPDPRWSTQRRHLEVVSILLGLEPLQAGLVRESISVALSVPGMVLAESAGKMAEAKGFRMRGEAIVAVLMEVAAPRLRRVLAAGHLAGLWGEPFLDDGGPRLRPLAFGGERGPPREGG